MTAESVSQNAKSGRWRDGGNVATEPNFDSEIDSLQCLKSKKAQ